MWEPESRSECILRRGNPSMRWPMTLEKDPFILGSGWHFSPSVLTLHLELKFTHGWHDFFRNFVLAQRFHRKSAISLVETQFFIICRHDPKTLIHLFQPVFPIPQRLDTIWVLRFPKVFLLNLSLMQELINPVHFRRLEYLTIRPHPKPRIQRPRLHSLRCSWPFLRIKPYMRCNCRDYPYVSR